VNKNSLQSTRRDFWYSLGGMYAHLLGAATSNVRTALDYALAHDRRAAHLYSVDPDRAEVDRLFGEGFTEELLNMTPHRTNDYPCLDSATHML
jgi:hypothetical protein